MSPMRTTADGKRDSGNSAMGLRLDGLAEGRESEEGEMGPKTPRDGGEPGTLIRLTSSAAMDRQLSKSKQISSNRE